MPTQFDLPPGTERASVKHDRLGYAETPEGTRRLVRIARVAHVEQVLTVASRVGSGEVVLNQRYTGEGAIFLGDWVHIGMAPDEARRIASLLIAGADAIDDGAMRAADGGQP